MKWKINKKRLRLHAWLALAFLALRFLVDGIGEPETFFPERVINNIWLMIFLFVNNFIFFEYTIPFIKLRFSRIVLGILLVWAHLMLYSFGTYGWRALGIKLHVYTSLMYTKSVEDGTTKIFPYAVACILFTAIFRHIYDYRQLRLAAQQLRIEKQEAELNYLKSQTNPHFLFNTLNNIYSLSRDKSDLAPESILRLSKILRFMLYETSGVHIAVEQELKVISDYIELEKLRYDDSLRINFNYDVEDKKQALPPLLLMPLVENAFKHGVSETRSRPFVDIHLSVNKRVLTFVVKNSSDSLPADSTVKENIGLSNLRRQLELLYSEYELKVQQGISDFTASLKINLASHVQNKMYNNRR